MTLAVHNVGQLTDDDVVKRFVVRQPELDELLSHLTDDSPPRHALMIGQRGMGKSLLLRKLAITVRSDPDLAARWLPLLMPEELYQVTSIGELWLAALDRLAVTLDDADLAGQRTALLAERDPARLETLALQRLLAAARGRGLRVLLLAENLDMLIEDQMGSDEGWSLRQALQTETDLLLVATAVTTFAVVEEAGEAFYGFFHRIDLHPLGDNEVRDLWHQLTGSNLTGDRIIPIRILTGGNPRLITVLARFSRKPDLSDLRQDLELLIDEYTPYFKANIEVLPAVERKVFITLADIWAPATASEVAERTRMTSSQVSALLGRLVRRGAVQAVEQEHGKQRYELTERLYNLYHLLRTPDGKGRVRALVDILVHLFGPAELEQAVFSALVDAPTTSERPGVDTLVASQIERYIDESGLWDQSDPEGLKRRLPVLETLLAKQRAELGDNHADTLFTRQNLAFIVGALGDPVVALQLYREILDQQERICGSDHPDTLGSRHQVACYVGASGDQSGALDLYRQLSADCERILGPDNPRTLRSRHQVAYFTGATHDLRSALELFRQLAIDHERIHGRDDPRTLGVRRQVAYYIGETADTKMSLEIHRRLASDSERILGREDRDTLVARHQFAYFAREAGDSKIAVQVFRELAADSARILGPRHPDTLTTLHNLARCLWESGDQDAGLAMWHEVAADRQDVLGPTHTSTLNTEHHIAYYTWQKGDPAGALEVIRDVLTKAESLVGLDSDLLAAIRELHALLHAQSLDLGQRIPREFRDLKEAVRPRAPGSAKDV